MKPNASKIETANFVIHSEPRISATKLAEYVVANPTRQSTIAKNAKVAPKILITPYKKLRAGFLRSFDEGGLNMGKLLASAQDADTSSYKKEWERDDNKRSADALKNVAAISEQIKCAGGKLLHRPAGGWGSLAIKGVKVSVNPEIVFSIEHRGVTKLGAVILNTSQGASYSLAKANDDHAVGDYLTTLLYRLIEERMSSVGAPLHTKCYAIDVSRKTIYSAPSAHKTLLKHLDNACEMIALRWDKIPVNVEEIIASES